MPQKTVLEKQKPPLGRTASGGDEGRVNGAEAPHESGFATVIGAFKDAPCSMQ